MWFWEPVIILYPKNGRKARINIEKYLNQMKVLLRVIVINLIAGFVASFILPSYATDVMTIYREFKN